MTPSTPIDLVVLGYSERLTEDHDTIIAVAKELGLNARLVTPSQVSLHVDHSGEHVRVDGERFVPRAVVPRGINRPWPMLKQILECWYTDGAPVVSLQTVISLPIDPTQLSKIGTIA